MLLFVFVWTFCITDVTGRPLDFDPYGPAPVLPAPPMAMDRKHGLGRNTRIHHNADFYQYGQLTNTGPRVRSPIPKRSSDLSNYLPFIARNNNRKVRIPGSKNSYQISGGLDKIVQVPLTKTVFETRRIPIVTFKKIPRVVMKKVNVKVPVIRMVSQIVDLDSGKVLGEAGKSRSSHH